MLREPIRPDMIFGKDRSSWKTLQSREKEPGSQSSSKSTEWFFRISAHGYRCAATLLGHPRELPDAAHDL
jgi:hypothetical protein